MGLAPGSLQATVAAYNAAAARGEDPLLHKKPEWLKPIGSPVGAIDLRESTGGFTLGGLRTSLDAEVLHVSGEPIPGLFAAGRSPRGWPPGVMPAASRWVTAASTAAAPAAPPPRAEPPPSASSHRIAASNVPIRWRL